MIDTSGMSEETAAIVQAAEAAVAAYRDEDVYVVPENGDYDHRVVHAGLFQNIVCTRIGGEEAAAWITVARPPGTQNGAWMLDTGQEPITCQQFPDTHQHYVVEC